jgi:hypothetical protein
MSTDLSGGCPAAVPRVLVEVIELLRRSTGRASQPLPYERRDARSRGPTPDRRRLEPARVDRRRSCSMRQHNTEEKGSAR